jgi:hypothetical protein
MPNSNGLLVAINEEKVKYRLHTFAILLLDTDTTWFPVREKSKYVVTLSN